MKRVQTNIDFFSIDLEEKIKAYFSYAQDWLQDYGKFSKIRTLFFFLFQTKMFVIRAEIHKMLVRITNREEPYQTVSEEAVWSGSALFV